MRVKYGNIEIRGTRKQCWEFLTSLIVPEGKADTKAIEAIRKFLS